LLSQFVRVAVFSWHIHVHLMSCALIWHSIVAVRYNFTHEVNFFLVVTLADFCFLLVFALLLFCRQELHKDV